MFQIRDRSRNFVNDVNRASVLCTVYYRYISDSKGSLVFMHLLCDTAQDLPYSESVLTGAEQNECYRL